MTAPQFRDASPQQTPATPLQMPAQVPVQTAPQPPSPPPAPALPPTVVTAEPETRLDQLCAEFARVKPEADELAAKVKELSEAIKHETMQRAPEGSSSAVLRSPHLPTAYRVTAREEMRFESAKFKMFDPATYARFARKVTSWRLEPVR